MEKRKQAWIYCAIDAPEDTHGVLKKQLKQLCDYAEQMMVETVGSSSDCGGKPLLVRPGFRRFIAAAKEGKASVLLVVSRNSLTYSSIQMAQLGAMAESLQIEIWSPQEGKINLRDYQKRG